MEVLSSSGWMQVVQIFWARPDVLCPDVTKTFVPVVDDFAWGGDRPRNKFNKGIIYK